MYRIEIGYELKCSEDLEKSKIYISIAGKYNGELSDSDAGFGFRDLGFEFEDVFSAEAAFKEFKELEITEYALLIEDDSEYGFTNTIDEYDKQGDNNETKNS